MIVVEKKSSAAGLEPTHVLHNAFRVHRLNRSAKRTLSLFQIVKIQRLVKIKMSIAVLQLLSFRATDTCAEKSPVLNKSRGTCYAVWARKIVKDINFYLPSGSEGPGTIQLQQGIKKKIKHLKGRSGPSEPAPKE